MVTAFENAHRRVIYDLSFVTLSELRVGTGTHEARNLPTTQGPDEAQTVAPFLKAKGGVAWIPGATMKGAFRAASDDSAPRLFGKPHEETAQNTPPEAQFARGELTFFGFKMVSGAPMVTKTRTAVNPGTGASDANKLFSQDFVEVGTVFSGQIVLEAAPRRLDAARAEFAEILNKFAAQAGISIAAGKADGLGRVQLTKATATRCEMTENGWKTDPPQAVPLTPTDDDTWHAMVLECPGPYMVFGGTKGSGGETDPMITMPERRGNLPRLMATGVSGALRARAQWLASVECLQMGGTIAETKAQVQTSTGPQDRDIIERLFGGEGYRGSLQIRVDEVRRKRYSTHPAVPLDQLLHAPLDGGLHTRQADFGVSFNLSLRMWRKTASKEEYELFENLIADIKNNGLALGLGTAKGFGWFGMHPTPAEAVALGNHDAQDEKALHANFKTRLPDASITLPYRLVEVDINKLGMPEDSVQAAAKAQNLHNMPMANGLSGWVDVSWCFEVPMVVGDGGATREPQKLGSDYVLPGTTIRGVLRAMLEMVTHARISQFRHNAYERIGTDKRRGDDYPFRAFTNALDRSIQHNPTPDANYRPDFVQALFGFVIPAPERGTFTPKEHAALHLKSRVATGWAWLQHGLDTAKGKQPVTITLAAPYGRSVFQDHLGRRTYFADKADAKLVQRRLDNAVGRNEDMQSDIKFLHPKDKETLVFRGRIRFTNLTAIEVGALFWAITIGWQPYARHMIGQAKPLGAGRCFATDLDVILTRNDGASATLAPVTFDDDRQADAFGPDAAMAMPYVKLFDDWLEQHGLKTHGFHERMAAANPLIGKMIRTSTKMDANAIGYQTSESLKKLFESNRDKNPQQSKSLRSVAQENAGGSGGMRLAAMLKNKV